MSSTPKEIIGTNVLLKDIESAFRKHWREVADSEQAVIKASTLNLVLYSDRQLDIDEVLDRFQDIVEHHPGRVIIAMESEQQVVEPSTAHLSACAQKSRDGLTQISAEFIVLNKHGLAAGVLAGTILPLLLPDVPVYLWCEELSHLSRPDVKSLLPYADRLVLQMPYECKDRTALKTMVESILSLKEECHISDLTWAELTAWREAIAQLFDSELHQQFLSAITEVEITHSDEAVSTRAFLLAGWLVEALSRIQQENAELEDTIIFRQQASTTATVKITRKESDTETGVHAVKIFADRNDKRAIFAAKRQGRNAITTLVQIGGDIYPAGVVTRNNVDPIQRLCDELDFVQQDEAYLQTLSTIAETMNENRN